MMSYKGHPRCSVFGGRHSLTITLLIKSYIQALLHAGKLARTSGNRQFSMASLEAPVFVYVVQAVSSVGHGGKVLTRSEAPTDLQSIGFLI